MSALDRYLAELRAALRVRGTARRRFLRECRDHLLDAAAERGEQDAIRAFGPAHDVARAFDAEAAARRGLRATAATAAGVLATGGSTLVLIHGATVGNSAPTATAAAFFVAAQVAAVAVVLALLQALVLRRDTPAPADLLLLARRNACALAAAALTMLAAGAAVPGRASAVLLLAGPVLAVLAAISVLRARSLARRLGGAGMRIARPPLADLRTLTGLPVPLLGVEVLLALTTAMAAAGAFVRDRAEHATVAGALATAGVEGLAVIVCFAVLGRPLGLIPATGRR